MSTKRNIRNKPDNQSSEGIEEKLKFLTEEKVYEFIESTVKIEKWTPFVWLILSISSSLCLSISSFPSKMSTLNPYQIMLTKSAFGLALTLLYMRLNKIKLRFRYFKIRMIFLVGLSLFTAQAGFVFAINFMDFTFSLFLIYIYPLFAIVLARIWIKEPFLSKDFLAALLIQAGFSFCFPKDVRNSLIFEESLLQNDLNNIPLSSEETENSNFYFITAIIISGLCSMLLAFAYVAIKKLTETKAHPTVFLSVLYFWSLSFGWILVLTAGGFTQPTAGDWVYVLVESFIEFFGFLCFFKVFFLVSINKIVVLSFFQFLFKLIFTRMLFTKLDSGGLSYFGLSFSFFVLLLYFLREIFSLIRK